MTDYEKLGLFYLGRHAGAPLLYASKDLTTHAVCVGMTGSGKTGLLVALLEEAAIDGVPAIVIDPKGDLGNLLLAFPDLLPADFEPWVDPDEAARQGLEPAEFSAKTAQAWRTGLEEWGQSPDRIARFCAAVDIALYTPGSRAGLPLALIRSFRAPPRTDDDELLRDRATTSVAALLGMLGIAADPLSSREHILLARILVSSWEGGTDLDIAALIAAIQSPPFQRLGVVDLESFFPAADRNALAMSLNLLLASPNAASWMDGEPLDIPSLLYTKEGKPRLSILCISHLDDAQRMFFVTTVLNELLGWMRTQSGTSSLRAILLMDEIAGYFPPVANPPSKPPMLTLLKQARAFGLGVVLATQNPVDLDYRGLANIGTWMIGRLQTEQDKGRLLDGLQGVDRGQLDRMLSSLGQRTFLLNNVRASAPVLFQTRWTLSYLRGPLGRAEIRTLTQMRGAARSDPTAAGTPVVPPLKTSAGTGRPLLPAGLTDVFLPGPASSYSPGVYARARLHYVDAKRGVDVWEEVGVACAVLEGQVVEWAGVFEAPQLGEPVEGASFAAVPAVISKKGATVEWKRALTTWLQQSRPLGLPSCPTLGLFATQGESEGAFRARAGQAARERRDADIAKVEAAWAAKSAALEDRRRRAAARVGREQAQASAATMNTALSFGTALFGAIFGSKTLSVGNASRAATAVRSTSRVMQERAEVEEASEDLEALDAELYALEAGLRADLEAVRLSPDDLVFDTHPISPRKSDISVPLLALAWIPDAPQ